MTHLLGDGHDCLTYLVETMCDDSSPVAANRKFDPGATSLTLLDRVRQKSPDGWRRLADLYAPLVYRWCRASDVPAEDAADIVQEVFVAVARSIERFHRDAPGDSFRKWLKTIANNKIRDDFRQKKRGPRGEGGSEARRRIEQMPESPVDGSTCESQAADDFYVEHRAVELVSAAVEVRTWRAFWRTTVDGMPAEVVADELAMSTPAVYKAKYRVMKRLREEINRLNGVDRLTI